MKLGAMERQPTPQILDTTAPPLPKTAPPPPPATTKTTTTVQNVST